MILSTPSPAATTDTVLAELRVATRSRHDHIEQLLALEAPMPLARYRLILQGFHAFLCAWEHELRDALPERLHGWLAERSRIAFVEQDLDFLGLGPGEKPVVARCLPERSVAAAFGSLYVIEGSALGGQVITPRLQRDLGLAPGRGASYFNGFGDRTGGMWREFRQRAVSEVGDVHGPRRVACRAAAQTFDALIDSFEQLLASHEGSLA